MKHGSKKVNLKPMSDFPKAVIFDLDGTLVDTEPDLTTQLKATLSHHDIAYHDMPMRQWVGQGARAMIERALSAQNISLPEKRIVEIEADFLELYGQNCTQKSLLFDNVRHNLETLAHHNIKMAVCTNKREELARKILKSFEIDDFFSIICGRIAPLPIKPDKRALEPIENHLALKPHNMVMVGDSQTDIHFARATGMKIIAVSFGYCDKSANLSDADKIIDDWNEIGEALALMVK